MQVKDIIQKVNNDQFIIKELFNDNKGFAITESTPEEQKFKSLCIDFGNNISRFVSLDNLLLVLKEMYGKDYLITALDVLKNYDEVKDLKIK
jgi:hypothetical protein